MKKTTKDPIACLKKLGNTADKIAAKLKRLKILGEPQDAAKCPLARYLKRESFRKLKPEIDMDSVSLYSGTDREFSVTMPRAFQDFVYDFDHLVYKDLVPPKLLEKLERDHQD